VCSLLFRRCRRDCFLLDLQQGARLTPYWEPHKEFRRQPPAAKKNRGMGNLEEEKLFKTLCDGGGH